MLPDCSTAAPPVRKQRLLTGLLMNQAAQRIIHSNQFVKPGTTAIARMIAFVTAGRLIDGQSGWQSELCAAVIGQYRLSTGFAQTTYQALGNNSFQARRQQKR